MLPFLMLPLAGSTLDAMLASPRTAFEEWASAHAKAYGATEQATRFANFVVNLEKMADMAKRQPLASYAPDAFADHSEDELASLRGGAMEEVPPHVPRVAFSAAEVQAAREAGEVDWVKRGAVTTPSSQGRCATCAFFAGIAAAEGAWAVAGNPLVKLSEQQEIDCYNNGGYALPNIQAHGVARNADAPLANHSDPTLKGCRGITNCTDAAAHAFASIDGMRAPKTHNDVDILPLLALGPMAISIDAGPYNGYRGGILNCSASPPFHHVDHANALVGYGEQAPPAPCPAQPANKSYATYCGTGWSGRAWWKATEAASIDECCAACAALVGNGTWNDPACGAAVFQGGRCQPMATAPTGHALAGMPVPTPQATTCIPLKRAPVPTEPLAYWKVKNSWGPAFGEGGYARLLFGNNCLRGVIQPFVNSTRGVTS